jgi:hypothetical protein
MRGKVIKKKVSSGTQVLNVRSASELGIQAKSLGAG